MVNATTEDWKKFGFNFDKRLALTAKAAKEGRKFGSASLNRTKLYASSLEAVRFSEFNRFENHRDRPLAPAARVDAKTVKAIVNFIKRSFPDGDETLKIAWVGVCVCVCVVDAFVSQLLAFRLVAQNVLI